LKNKARDRLKEEIEYKKYENLETFGRHEGRDERIDARELESKDDEINKHKSEIDVLNITIKHLHDVLREKTDLSIEQQREIINLNQKFNQISFENTQLRAQNSLLTRKTHLDDARFDVHESVNARVPYNNEESKNYGNDDVEKLRLIEETESLLNRSKGYNSLDNEILDNISGEHVQYNADSHDNVPAYEAARDHNSFMHAHNLGLRVNRTNEPIIVHDHLDQSQTMSLGPGYL
jgi:hypothetical protein